jgi:tight adherence protein B
VVLPLAAGLATLAVAGVAAGVIVTCGVVVARRTVGAKRERQRQARERAGAAEALSALAAELRAGRVPAEAFDAAAEAAVGATASAFSSAAAAVRWGGGPEESLKRHASSSAVPEMLVSLAACWQVCSGTGSSLATGVDRLDEALRQAARQRELVEAEVAQARASAGAMACLPLVGILLGYGMGGDPLHVLLHTPPGLVCLALGLGLDLLGLWWTRRLVSSAIGTSA